MEEIAAGEGGSRVWRSNREKPKLGRQSASARGGMARSSLRPMLATGGAKPPSGDAWVYEPKYDGIRVLAFVTPDAAALITRNGHDKARQFGEIVDALEALSSELQTPLVLDGEIVSLEEGQISRFERLQGRMHLQDSGEIGRQAAAAPAAFVAFDLLLSGDEVLLGSPWSERREHLEELLNDRETETLRISETADDKDALRRRAEREGWEGIMAKRRDAKYRPGERTTDWLKLKIENRQEFVVGGWTEPRKSRSHLGAILLGYYDDGKFVYAGHTGTGFTGRTLTEMYHRLKKLERKTPPFQERPKTNEAPHWTSPRVVVEVKFNEWTRDGKLRQPVFLGIRDDKDAKDVVREPPPAVDGRKPDDPEPESTVSSRKKSARSARTGDADTPLVRELKRIADAGGEGELRIAKGTAIQVTSFGKVFFPNTGHTKGDLLTYYARMAEYILPWMKDRPLVLKRFPNGVKGESFYQQAAPDSVPRGVRVDTVRIDGKDQRRLVGGNVATLLYTVQLGAISYDPWHSRVQDLASADYSIIDLDPGPGATFRRVVKVAGWVKEEMDELGLHGAVKTSGSSGLHIYLPLSKRTPLDAATLIARIVATRVAEKHPKEATVERMTKNRPGGTVYVDFLQNILGKTVAGVYAVRAKPTPTVSTPLAWDELTPALDLREFTIDTVPGRVVSVGDYWASAMAGANRLDRMLPSIG
jgi:bifunctional non-homologous end joining protein LigD